MRDGKKGQRDGTRQQTRREVRGAEGMQTGRDNETGKKKGKWMMNDEGVRSGQKGGGSLPVNQISSQSLAGKIALT